MIEEKKNSNKKVLSIVIVLILLVVVIGASFALWSTVFTGSDNVISTEDISIEYLESTDVIDITNALPMSESQGKSGSDTFDFEVTTRTSKNANMEYSIILEPMTVDEGYTALNDSDINLYLTDENDSELVTLNIGDIAKNSYIIYSDVNRHDSLNNEIKDRYSLRVWLDEEVNASNWDQDTKLQYKFRINIDADAKSVYEIKGNASDELIKIVGLSGLEEVTHEKNSTLQIGATEDITEYRYRGGNDVVTNNYVYFNCTDISNQTSDTCELYRIIGVFPTDDGTGNIQSRVKLIKAENYGNNYWNNSTNINDWTSSSLNTTFNTTYWGTINEDYQELVREAKYYLGGYTGTELRTNVMYGYERKIDESDGGNYYYDDRPTNWTGKMALMYASDYGYAASSECSESYNLSTYNNSTCASNNWLYLGSYEWLLPQTSAYSDYAFRVNSSGAVNYHIHVNNVSVAVRPTFYLTSETQIVDGEGTSGNPYQLSVQ